MVVFGALVPVALHHFTDDSRLTSPCVFLGLTAALALGELVCLSLGRHMGRRGMSMSLFGTRSVLLVFSRSPRSSLLLFLGLSVVFLSHDAAFSPPEADEGSSWWASCSVTLSLWCGSHCMVYGENRSSSNRCFFNAIFWSNFDDQFYT